MNRLWVRFSLAFVAVILLSLCTFPIVAIIAFIARDALRAPQLQAAPVLYVPVHEPFQAILVGSSLLILGLIIVLGIVLSRSLTAPLNELAVAAKRFAARDWNQRVPVRGAMEVQEVSTAFNQMVDELQKQETLRRNLMADIAHELRTPLTVMQGNLSAMLDQMYPVDRAEIATLYDETRLLSRLVEDLRELALADAGRLPLKIQVVSVGELLEKAMSNFAAPADAQNVRVEMRPVENLPAVRADPDRVMQVLTNLLGNALRHTPEGGMITTGAQPQEKWVRVFVRDTGEGISAEDAPHIFDRFYRADKSRTRATGGTGLGLAIAKAWVEAMGGKIGVESKKGRGSEFWFTLPREQK
jgi:two-component system OmpR family sensor kinase/two-component system sensor histidine kinase BaeS